MRFGIIRGIDFSTRTKQAWQAQGGTFYRADRTEEENRHIASRNQLNFWLNLGNSQAQLANQEVPVVNLPHMISALIYPESIRSQLPDLAPPRPTSFDEPQLVWVKPPGHKGRGKQKVMTSRPLTLPDDWDWQAHIEGIEFRVVTVGRRAVQAFERFGDNADREYNWRGLQGAPEEVIRTARKAARHHERMGDEHCHNHMYAWDLILENETGNVYVFEGNTAPGVNNETAERIVNEIDRQIEEERIIA